MTHGQPTKESANHFDADRAKWILQSAQKNVIVRAWKYFIIEFTKFK